MFMDAAPLNEVILIITRLKPFENKLRTPAAK
ncbi:hypothetical protein B2K_38580 [Paenibacillus mucilaginosus K02]|uniref:Uncharacterized protein n=1 Tax=Paenibacillus mucilaginosus K02 TaxID=997761 RepID=R9UMV5_9BACL|nr:hypothetical protein B2K_38580 [Paenibacillus mucilaginosus K02]